MTDHGRLYDNFTRQPGHDHGGSYFDAGFGLQAKTNTHGKLHDLFGVPADSERHGERYDEFGWHDMPAIHGQQFDSDFRQPTAHQGTGHGTWFDTFRGGTQVRYMLEGADYEGVVIECHPDHAIVRDHAGQTHEVGLSQFLAYRTPNEQQASPSIPESSADAPSARSADAHGAFNGERSKVPTDMPPVIQEAPQGQYTEPRTGVPAGSMDTFTHLKSLADRYDADDVAKEVTSAETATQGAPAKTVGHRNNCPRGGSAPCGAAVDGVCSICKAQVHDHDAVGKATTGDLGIKVPEREHKSTDHHSNEQLPGRCPHCGKVLAEVDHQTEQGHPGRRSKQGEGATFDTVTHKCLGTTLDVLKTLTEAS